MSDPISLADIQAARARIAEHIQPLRISASQVFRAQKGGRASSAVKPG